MKVKTLNKNQFEASCKQLFDQITPKPDLVIGISNGGAYVLDEFKKCSTDTLFQTVCVQRPTTTSFKTLSWVRGLLKLLPYKILNRLRITEHKKRIIKSNNQLVKCDIDFSGFSTIINSVLILDDALDTGNTLKSVIQTIQEQATNVTIKTGVIVWTNSVSQVQPDYFVFKDELVRFHWSLDYKTNIHG